MINGKKVLAVIPARGGSKGIKKKNLKLFMDLPLVAHVGKFVEKIDYIDKSIVSTDDIEISKVANKYSLESPFMRPENLSGDRIGDVPVLKHALIESEKIFKTKFDIILMLQPTAPLRKKEDVIAVLEKITTKDFNSVWTITESDPKAHPLKQLELKEDQSINLYDEAGLNIIARQQLKKLYFRNGDAYAFKRDALLNNDNVLLPKTSYVISTGPSANIDTEEDLIWAEYLYRRKITK